MIATQYPVRSMGAAALGVRGAPPLRACANNGEEIEKPSAATARASTGGVCLNIRVVIIPSLFFWSQALVHGFRKHVRGPYAGSRAVGAVLVERQPGLLDLTQR